MSQCDRKRELTERQVSHQPRHAAAVELDHTATNLCATAGAKTDDTNRQADERIRERPDDSQGEQGRSSHSIISHNLASDY